MASLNFDATTVAPNESIEAIPAGWYNAQIDQSELKPTKDGSSAYLELRFSILDGQFVNRKVFTRLNIRNSNPVAQEIAYKQLSAICHATGVMQVQDSQQLHARPLKIKVKVRAATGDYEASNEISAFKNVNENVTGAAPAPASAAPWANAAPATANAAPANTLAPAAQFAQPVGVVAHPATPAWQPPAAAQPWASAPAQPAAAQPAAAQPAAAQPATPPWMQQAAASVDTNAAPPWAAPRQ